MRIKIDNAYLTEKTSEILKNTIEKEVGKELTWDEVYDVLYGEERITILKEDEDFKVSIHGHSKLLARFPHYSIGRRIEDEWVSVYSLAPNEDGIVYEIYLQ